MGWWFSIRKGDVPKSKDNKGKEGRKMEKPTTNAAAVEPEVPGMNSAMEVPRPDTVTVFEFGSVAASSDKITLAGYCPVSDKLEACRWEILYSTGSNALQFRVVF